ncbi:hypothetical protein FOG18_06590 [Legionella israelensis]|uniref:hypothetical protein n=1 Tax=Legionella israelensis TaxID=454 RepID=UPI00117C684A|nr:hypothetical protein [Legionella israelensis]QDP72249.1 hypothetical protein FOG18_06590 [Legionella israelensis]
MDVHLKKYIKTFLHYFQLTLCSETRLQKAKNDFGKGPRCQLQSFAIQHWSEMDRYAFSAAYFEAIAAANEEWVNNVNGAHLTAEFKAYIDTNIMPQLIENTSSENWREIIKQRIATEQEKWKGSLYKDNPLTFWGLAGSAALVGAVAAVSYYNTNKL